MTIQEARANIEEFLRYLVAADVLSSEGAGRASHALASTTHPLDTVLTELGLLREDELASHLTVFLKLPGPGDFADLDQALINSAGLQFCEDNAIIPLALEPDTLLLATCDPFSGGVIDALAFHFDRTPTLRIATRSQITGQFKMLQLPAEAGGDDRIGEFDGEATAHDIDRLRDIAREAPVVRLVTRVINEAVERGATDIHVEPQEDNVRIRIRFDGMLTPVETAPRSLHAGIVTRIKIMAQLNIAERRIPQDGRMRVVVRGQNIDLRVSVVPSVHGEAIVLRILDRSRVKLELAALGFDQQARDRLSAWSHAANGILLITGPTGSGKTTTLYSLLKERNSTDTKIFTVEDPIEYRLAGVTQLQVEPAIDLDFATALRSVLRQDPDVILVGEIRDRETAEIAIRAALTGHLVLSTLHTNSAAGAFTRLTDIGIDSYLLGATIRGVIGQRLLRRTCPQCKGRSAKPAASPAQAACPSCRNTGYSGRVVAYEMLPVTEKTAALINSGAREEDIHAAARQEGMLSLLDHARGLVRDGVTTEAEVRRVIELGEA
ncbi:GspE/PulE family protein [Mesorhizobium sp. ZC-5]|uniref:GspE/PulE family protein n=1 Tax=Mesorhizobium sp. ZC-5 TaxID=2986066 RepID=UPI0021E8822C|nr:GspE/PulE family protein [Mesorhizobium sp. ZC-5]MCV3243108.1 GspE/PulE family protein [Mesorhizobium sp. ZC-5]